MAIRIGRVYTRTGDDGETSLARGGRVPKDAQRVEAYGAVDELNSAIGVAREEVAALAPPLAGLREEMEPLLARVQRSLFDLGAYLAIAPGEYREGMPSIRAEDVTALEAEMDRWGKDLPSLQSFILPGGGRLGALLHVARSSCRRAEREAVRLHRVEPIAAPALAFLNRLSDWLFVAARHAAKAMNVPEFLWRDRR